MEADTQIPDPQMVQEPPPPLPPQMEEENIPTESADLGHPMNVNVNVSGQDIKVQDIEGEPLPVQDVPSLADVEDPTAATTMEEPIPAVENPIMDQTDEQLLGVPNPWSIDDLEEFLFYCCPQCDHQAKGRVSFLNHAFLSHPEVSKHILTFDMSFTLTFNFFAVSKAWHQEGRRQAREAGTFRR